MLSKYRSHIVMAVLAMTLCLPVTDVLAQQDPILHVMQEEIAREMETLKSQDPPAYFLSYRVDDSYNSTVSASMGALSGSNDRHRRHLTVQLRVGDYAMDNTREIRGGRSLNFEIPQFIAAPVESNEEALRMVLWNATNQEYRKAAKKYQEVRANTAVKVEAEDQSEDFARIPKPEQHVDPPFNAASLLPDRPTWEQKLKRYSRGFLASEHIFEGDARLTFTAERKRIATNEGAAIAENRVAARLILSATIKCEDGMELPLHKSYFAYDISDLPPDEQVLSDVRVMVETLTAMREAPTVEPFTGPALLSGKAAGVFFHEIFGHRVEGHRQKKETEGQTFKKKEGSVVLPDHMTVVFDPTLKRYHAQDLNGYYVFDDEGVRGQNVTVVDHGILKDFLMNRTPFEKHPASNGHGRAQTGYQPVSRQSNLVVETDNPRSENDLRDMLLEECRKQNTEFGLYFKSVQGGFTMTGRYTPNAFNVTPTEVYRIYVDGRPDELVRGVDLVGTPLVMFSNITAAGDDPAVFNGTCGAESGGVPVSAVSPTLLVSQIEVQKKSKSQELAPLLPRPDQDSSTPQPRDRTY